MVKNIVFDMGNVLIRFDRELFLDSLDLSPEDRALLTNEVFRSLEWARMDRGSLTEAQAVESICQRLPRHLHSAAKQLVENWDDPILPVEGMCELIEELKAAGYGIYLLSNASVALRTYFPRIPGSEYFDGLMVSAEEKLVKPQPEIFRLLCDRFHLKPEECVFVDDSPANVESAILTGMDGLVFYGDAQRLRRELTEKGISLP